MKDSKSEIKPKFQEAPPNQECIDFNMNPGYQAHVRSKNDEYPKLERKSNTRHKPYQYNRYGSHQSHQYDRKPY